MDQNNFFKPSTAKILASATFLAISSTIVMIYGAYLPIMGVLALLALGSISYLLGCAIFHNFRKLKLLYILALPLILIAALFLHDAIASIFLGMSEPCLDMNTGRQCSCDGQLIDSCCLFCLCEFRAMHCFGEITGWHYQYLNNQFETLEEWAAYCDTQGNADCKAELSRYSGR